MKKIIFCLILFFNLLVFCQDNHFITDKILYTVRFDNNLNSEGSIFNFLDIGRRKVLINQFCDLARNYEIIPVYYWGDTIGRLPYINNTIRKDEASKYFSWDDTMKYMPDTNNNIISFNSKRNNQVYRNFINSLTFLEKWNFDISNNLFIKRINGVVLFQDSYTNDIGMRVNYYLPLNDSAKAEYLNDNYIGEIIYDVKVTKSYDEKCNDENWWYNYLEPSNRESLFNLFTFKAIYDTVKPFKVYNGLYPYDSLINRTPYHNTGLSGNYYYGRSNWFNGDPLMYGMTDLKIQACCLELSDWRTIRKIRFHEKWYFDPLSHIFEKKVIGIGMIVDIYDELGNVIGEKCPVYYKFYE